MTHALLDRLDVSYPQSAFLLDTGVGNLTNLGPVVANSNDPGNCYRLEANTSLVYAFSGEVAGLSSIRGDGFVDVGFTESCQFIGNRSDESAFYGHVDGTLPVMLRGRTTLGPEYVRAFRYATLTTRCSPATVCGMSVAAEAHNKLTGAFSSSDDLINRIWYAGSYTNQLCIIPANTSVDHLFLAKPVGWANNDTVKSLRPTDVFISDGAKRDRNPWAGDLSIAVPSVLVSVNAENLIPVRNALSAMFLLQSNITGRFPYAGSPLGALLAVQSDTYNLWTVIGLRDYVVYSGDADYGRQNVARVTRALDTVVLGANGLANGSATNDWGRNGLSGESTELNAMYYHALLTTAELCDLYGYAGNATAYRQRAVSIKSNMNSILFDSAVGLFRDNTTVNGNAIHPQDGNVLAVKYNVTDAARSLTVSRQLAARWTKYGAPAPELPGAISPFIGSHEVDAHIVASPANVSTAMALVRRQWGYMLAFTGGSSLIEGYNTNGSIFYPFYTTQAFTSHAHAWSTGPTQSLTAQIVGISPRGFVVGQTGWRFWPKPAGSGLDSAEASFVQGNGTFAASWRLAANGSFSAIVQIPTSAGLGEMYLPANASNTIRINGQQPGSTSTRVQGFVTVGNLPAGNHTVVVS